MTPRQQELMTLLVSKGLHVKGAGAGAGNCSQEVGINLPSKFTLKTDHGSQGICQWRLERLTALEKFADDNKLPVTDLTTQGLFFLEELKRYPALNSMLRQPGSRSVANLTANFMQIFERPSHDPAINKLDFRIEQAELCVREFKAPIQGDKTPIILAGTGSTGAAAMVLGPTVGMWLAVAGLILVVVAGVLAVVHWEQQRELPATPPGPPTANPATELKDALEELKVAFNRVNAAKAVLVMNRQEGDALLEQLSKLGEPK